MSDERIDRLIDQVAREMTGGAPSSDLRARVLAHLEGRPQRWRLWMLAPIPAAALIIVAILVARRGPERPALHESMPPVAHVAPAGGHIAPAPDVRLLPSPPGGVGGTEKRRTTNVLTRPGRRLDTRSASRWSAASEVEALAPSPITAPPIAVGALTTVSIAVQEMEPIAPIAVAPLQAPEGERP